MDIGEDQHENPHAYLVNTEGIPSFERKKRYFEGGQKKKIGLDSVLLPSSKDSVRFFTGNSHQANEMITDLKGISNKYPIISLRVLD